jgi:hypothetical protein
MGDPASSYATASIALRVSGAHHHEKVEIPSVGKGKVIPLFKYVMRLYVMRYMEEWKYSFFILTSALDGGELSASRLFPDLLPMIKRPLLTA